MQSKFKLKSLLFVQLTQSKSKSYGFNTLVEIDMWAHNWAHKTIVWKPFSRHLNSKVANGELSVLFYCLFFEGYHKQKWFIA